MLAEVAQEELTKPPVVVKVEDNPLPLVLTGANLDLVGDASLRASRSSQVPQDSQDASQEQPQGLRVVSVSGQMTSLESVPLKRSISSVINEVRRNKKKRKVQQTQKVYYYTEVQSLGKAPIPDENTRYLTSLLHNRRLTLYLQPAAKLKKGSTLDAPKTYNILISQAGLVQHENLSTLSYTRALPLSLHDQDISSTQGPISRTVVGELLEDVWPKLNKNEKYQYARQLRNILHKIRAPGKTGDKHPEHTYYAIRTRPDQKHFMALLMSTLYETVPSQVAKALVSQFQIDYQTVLTHGALCPNNIIVSNNTIAWILGWDCAGHYPAWWEYVRFFEARTAEANGDWYDYAADIFEDEFPKELAAYQGIARCQHP
ncbi:hypothetical protein F66182_7848 [Fusarium sp. NRRL 66182]|nr:hypothetical protein F66182_7848 [Fusarium sp. NRRL 66182]